MKQPSLRSLRKKARDLFSKWVRQKEKGVCYTCGTRHEWKETDCGHFYHRDSLDFSEEGNHCQCTRCNRFLHGNTAKYAEHLVRDYGPDIIKELIRLGDNVRKFKQQELLDLIEKYK